MIRHTTRTASDGRGPRAARTGQGFDGALRTLERHVDAGRLSAEAGMRIFDLDGHGPTRDEFRRVYHAADRVNFVAHR